jgi:hypothetical protein
MLSKMSAIPKTQSAIEMAVDHELIEETLQNGGVNREETLQLLHDIALVNGKVGGELLTRFQEHQLYAILNEQQQARVDNIVNGGSTKPLKRYVIDVVRALIVVGRYDVPKPGFFAGWAGINSCLDDMDGVGPRSRPNVRRNGGNGRASQRSR